MTRLTSQMLVGALLRRVEGAGGFAMIIQKGDPIGGVIMIQAMEKGQFRGFFERMTDLSGKQSMVACGPEIVSQDIEKSDYIARRRKSDPDLWLVELDVAAAERFAAETLCND